MSAGKRHHVVTDVMLRTLGLDICADTQIGSALTRGISGGQRKRVTTGMIFTTTACGVSQIQTGVAHMAGLFRPSEFWALPHHARLIAAAAATVSSSSTTQRRSWSPKQRGRAAAWPAGASNRRLGLGGLLVSPKMGAADGSDLRWPEQQQPPLLLLKALCTIQCYSWCPKQSYQAA